MESNKLSRKSAELLWDMQTYIQTEGTPSLPTHRVEANEKGRQTRLAIQPAYWTCNFVLSELQDHHSNNKILKIFLIILYNSVLQKKP